MAKKKASSTGYPSYPKKEIPLQKAADKAANAPNLPPNYGRAGQNPVERSGK